MMLCPTRLRINNGKCNAETIVAARDFELSWALSGHGTQREFMVRVLLHGDEVWCSGWVKSEKQCCRCSGLNLESGFEYGISLSVRDEEGNENSTDGYRFRTALLEEWDADWIAPAEDLGDAVIYFERALDLPECTISNAVLYVCGIGYHHVMLNDKEVNDHRLAPAVSSYDKRCYYEVIDLTDALTFGLNKLEVAVAQGWRRNMGEYLGNCRGRGISFFGRPQLTAKLVVHLADGRVIEVKTDTAWSCRTGNITFSNLFDGETYDARIHGGEEHPCAVVCKPGEDTVMCPQELEPIRIKKYFAPVSMHEAGGGYIFDLGQNIAGVAEIHIPPELPEGTVITLQHAELLDENGDLYTAPLRGAKATDRYIAGAANERTWSPRFTYHGFRYVKVTGLPFTPEKTFLRGMQFYTDVDSGSSFHCGSAIVNEIQKMIVMTERDNLHSIATDCPQRDERMGWMNDATVRFEELPYNFDAGRLFPKIVRDICDAQVDGAITCTAPYVYGNRPADPVSSSFLVAAQMSYLHYGNTELIREAYPAFCAWNDCLARNSTDGIVDLTYYGDWAGPEDCCDGSPRSAVTPGIFMSTGYHYYNSKLLASFAAILGKDSDRERHEKRADEIRSAMLSKWLSDDGKICTGSQACQAFALRLGILPDELRAGAAKLMNDEVVKAGMRITTGNLCTLYLMEMLSEYGYVDTAWELITREEYPSWGYMLQNGATTVWERFELKKDPGMNSHCHPMYGAVGKWFYSHLAGIAPLEPGFEKALIRPYMPKKLLSVQAAAATCRGDISVRWEKTYGETRLLTSIPCGMSAVVQFGGKTEEVDSGTHIFRFAGSEE